MLLDDPTHARAFPVRDALEHGFTPHALRTSGLVAPAWGARLLHSTGEPDQDLLAALDALRRPDQFLSHSTAARIHGLPLPRRIGRIPIHVASPSQTARMRRPGVVGHRIKARIVEVGGLRVEAVEDCFVHVARQLDHDELVAVGDAIVATGRVGRLTVADLARNAERYRGARGMALVHRALGAIRVGAESPRETMLRLLLVRAGMPEPQLQIEVRSSDGLRIGRLDMGWRRLRVGVEYDGQHHRTDSVQYARDVERHRRLLEAGWNVIRVSARDLDDGGRRVVGLVRAARATRIRDGLGR